MKELQPSWWDRFDEDAAVQRKASAAKILGQLRDSRAVPVLRMALKDKDRDVRAAAAKALGELKDLSAVPELIAILENKKEEMFVHISAIEALGRMKDSTALPVLEKASKDKVWHVAIPALRAMELVTGHPIEIDRLKQIRALPTEAAEKMVGIRSEVRTSGKKILVVDDEEDLRGLIVQILKMDGYEIVEARDGVEALKALEAAKLSNASVDLLMTDGNMPRMNGAVLMGKAKPLYPEMKIMLVSAGIPGIEDLTTLGAEFLKKPFGVKDLQDKVRALLPRSEVRLTDRDTQLLQQALKNLQPAWLDGVFVQSAHNRKDAAFALAASLLRVSVEDHPLFQQLIQKLGKLNLNRVIWDNVPLPKLMDQIRELTYAGKDFEISFKPYQPKLSTPQEIKVLELGKIESRPSAEPQPQVPDRKIETSRSEMRTYETPAVSHAFMLEASLAAKIGTALRVAANTVSPLLSSSPVYASEIVPELFPGRSPGSMVLSGTLAKEYVRTAQQALGIRTVTASDVFVLGHEFFSQDFRLAAGMREVYPGTLIVAIVNTTGEREFLKELNLRLAKKGQLPILAAGAKNPNELKAHLNSVRGFVRATALLYGAETVPDALKQQLPNTVVVTQKMLGGFLNVIDSLVTGLVHDLQAQFAMAKSA
jgi:two-component system response regulator CpxR